MSLSSQPFSLFLLFTTLKHICLQHPRASRQHGNDDDDNMYDDLVSLLISTVFHFAAILPLLASPAGKLAGCAFLSLHFSLSQNSSTLTSVPRPLRHVIIRELVASFMRYSLCLWVASPPCGAFAVFLTRHFANFDISAIRHCFDTLKYSKYIPLFTLSTS